VHCYDGAKPKYEGTEVQLYWLPIRIRSLGDLVQRRRKQESATEHPNRIPEVAPGIRLVRCRNLEKLCLHTTGTLLRISHTLLKARKLYAQIAGALLSSGLFEERGRIIGHLQHPG
jgi:hypothetical protein